MYDCHYDLLTYIYMNKNNLEEVKKYCDKIFRHNIEGGIFNLFYMSEREMLEELDIEAKEIDIINNLKEVKELINKENLIPKNINYKIGIEGLDYLNSLEEVDTLFELGVRSVNPVWNNHNKFGTGVRPIKILNEKKGLTELGKKLIIKLIETNIAIDLSHTDEETFWDIIEECRKNKELSPKILASHSNCKGICDVPRNLTDEQIKAITEFDGIIGIVGVKQFCTKEAQDYEEAYIRHINYLKNLLGGTKNIALATDDMTYYRIEPEYYKNMNVFKQFQVNKKINKLLEENKYTKEEIEQITKGNYTNFWK